MAKPRGEATTSPFRRASGARIIEYSRRVRDLLMLYPNDSPRVADTLIVAAMFWCCGCRYEEPIAEYWAPKSSVASTGPTYETPSGWKELPTIGGMRLAAFEVQQETSPQKETP